MRNLNRFADPFTINEEVIKNNTGFKREDFLFLCGQLQPLRNTQQRTTSQALAVYLFWLKTGLDIKTVAAHFEISNEFDVFRYINQIREGLTASFVKENLGVNHLSRNEWVSNNSKIASELFCTNEEQFIIIADGTYCYCQKSANNFFQRKTYSAQKKQHLVKPFVVTASNGRIIDIFGPFEATKNDASILAEVLKDENGLITVLKENDIVLLDRGFRDCIESLEADYGLCPKIPSFLRKKEKQLDTKDANYSRLVTKCRWVIEVTNSFLMTSFQALRRVKNKQLKTILKDFRIAAALINRFFKRLYSDDDDKEIAIRIKQRLNEENGLKNHVIMCKSHLKSQNTRIEDCLISDFPVFSLQMIKNYITLGNYQLNQSLSYIAEHLNGGKYEILINKEYFDIDGRKILLAEIQSRHKNSAIYRSFIKYLPNSNEPCAISSWYCNCLCGSRTVGCCSHIASIIYYLSFARHDSDLKYKFPAAHLNDFFHTVESSDSESESEEEPDYDEEYENFEKNSIMSLNTEANQSSSECEILSQEMKRSLSFASEKNIINEKTKLKKIEDDFLISKPEWFKDYIPYWGGFIIDENETKTEISIRNTCSIDYFLFAIWISAKLSDKCLEKIKYLDKSKNIYNLIEAISDKNWDKAKTIWVFDICKKKASFIEGQYVIDVHGSHYNQFTTHLIRSQSYISTERCLNSNCPNNYPKTFESTDFDFIIDGNELLLNYNRLKIKCDICLNITLSKENKMNNMPPFLFVENNANNILNREKITVDDLPDEIYVDSQKYIFLCCSIYRAGHFKSIFYFEKKLYLIDDCDSKNICGKIPNRKFNLAFYYISK